MKRITMILFLYVFVLLFSSCANNNAVKTTSAPTIEIPLLTPTPSIELIPTPSPTPTPTPESTPTPLPERENTDFRSVMWGDSMETVKNYEKETEEGENKLYCLDEKLLDINVSIIYNFNENNQLYEISCLLRDEYNVGYLYISNYNSLKDALVQKYGKPIEDKKNKLDSLADYTDDATALTLGYLAYTSKWEIERTNIDMILITINYKTSMMLSYKSKEILPPEQNTDGL